MTKLVLTLVAFAALAFAQTVLNGDLDDPLWQRSTPSYLTPAEPGVPDDGGEIRTAIAGRYVYIAARLPETTARFTARSLGRNPNWEEEDLFQVAVGADLLSADWVIRVNPLGAYSVERKGMTVAPERFMAAARTAGTEWRVEIAVPLHLLNTPPLETIRVSAARIRAARPGMAEQRWRWPEREPAAKISGPDPLLPDAPDPVLRRVALGTSGPPVTIARVPELPTSDVWDDASWARVTAVDLTRNEPAKRTPMYPSQVKLVHDGEKLAVLARCDTPEGGPKNGESFQVLLATSGSGYARITVDARGSLSADAGKTGGSYVARPREWSSWARSSVRAEPGAWLVRLDIPLRHAATILGESALPSEWRLLFVRSVPGGAGQPQEVSVFPVTESATTLCPSRYQRTLLAETGLPQPRAITPKRDGPASLDSRVFSPEQRRARNLSTMLYRQLRSRTLKVLEAERRDWEKVSTRADWERYREPRLNALASFFGEFPQRGPLQTRVTKEYRGQGYRRQDLVYLSRPGIWVPANLYLPAKSAGPMPAIIVIHSHHRPRTNAELQDMGILWARQGAAVLIMDQPGSGERMVAYPWNREAYHSRYVLGMQLYLAGDSLMKWMVWDVMRSVDLLLQRSDIRRDGIVLLGAVAGGGDPAAIAAALDRRIAAVAPFNFGEATPRSGARTDAWPDGMADPNWGSWETTRNLPNSISQQFLPWFICASVAPRRFIYSYEMGWNVEEQPAWQRYLKVFSLYDALDRLDEAHGFGPFPGPGECTNIGPAQRKTLYPELERWFGIRPPAVEPEDRRPEAELAAITPAVASSLAMRPIHEVAREEALAKLATARRTMANLTGAKRLEWLRSRLAVKLGRVEPTGASRAEEQWKKQMGGVEVSAIALEVEPGITVPLLLLWPQTAPAKAPVVIGLSQGGKDEFLQVHHEEIRGLLDAGIAVCLPDVRGTGETRPDSRRDPGSAEIALAATELMLGDTLLGARLRDTRSVLSYVATLSNVDAGRIALWGDSAAPPNPENFLLDEFPNWQIGPEIQHQAEPLGGLLALLTALYDDRVKAIAVRRGLSSFASVLDDAFAYLPADVVVPGLLEVADVSDVAAALAPRALLMESLVNGRNALLSEASARSALGPVYSSYGSSRGRLVVGETEKTGLAGWLRDQL